MNIRKNAFTLAEVLIALAIIGVIATISIPQVIANRMAVQAKSSFETAFANLSRAVSEMEADEVSTSPSNYLNYNSETGSFYGTLKKYMTISLDCGLGGGSAGSFCASNDNGKYRYKYYNGNEIPASDTGYFDDGAFMTNNGMFYMIENNPTPGNSSKGLLVSIDINGKSKGPNKWGWDLFTFEVKEGSVFPVGSPETTNAEWRTNPKNFCDLKRNSQYNGITCGFWALGNETYFKDLYNGR